MNWNTTKILRVCSLAMVLMLTVMAVGMPIPQLGGQPAVQTQPAVQEAEASATLVALGFMSAGVVAESVYDTYVTPRDPAEMQDDELKVAIAQDAYSMKQTQENYITDSQNALELSKNDARQEAYQAYVNARMDGASHADAVSSAKKRVDDFYAKHELQLIRKYETQVAEGGGYCSMAEQWRDLGTADNVRYYEAGSGDYATIRCSINDTRLGSDGLMVWSQHNAVDGYSLDRNSDNQVVVTQPLANGTNVTYRTFAFDAPTADGWYAVMPTATAGHDDSLEVYDPDAGSYVQIAMKNSPDAYPTVFDDIQTQHANVQDTLGNSTSGFLSQVDEYHATHNVTWAELAVEEPDMENMTTEETVRWQLAQYHDGPPQGTVVTIETANGTYNGTLYTTWAPSTDPDDDGDGEWVTGHQYDAGQGSTYVLTSGQVKSITGNMTITAIESPDGGSVDATEHKDVTLDTSDTSDLKKQIDRLNKRIKELEQQQNDGGWTIPSIGGNSGIAVIVLLVGAFLLLAGQGGGGTTVLTRRD